MKNKTKVVAFRVTDREHEAMLFAASRHGMKIADWVRVSLLLDHRVNELEAEVKRLEAKAKRAAKKAEKAAEAAEVPQ